MDTTQLLKGTLDAAVLAVIADEDGYGYDVVRRLRESGLEEVGDASVYGTLRRLFASGSLTSYVVASEEGPAPQVLRAHTRRPRRPGRLAQGLGRVRPRHGPPAGIPADRGDALMNDDTTGTTAFPTPDGEPTMVLPGADPTLVLPGADSTPTTVLGAPGIGGSPIGAFQSGGQGAAATAVLPDPRITPYLDAAAIHLADLPPGERAELLEDLAAHLAEIAADEGPAFATRLGSPDQYAAEFRASAGYPPARIRVQPAQRAPGRLRTLGHDAAAATRDLGARIADGVRGFPGGTALMTLLPRLRPAWWVFRAWLAALVVGVDWPTGAYNGIGHWGAFVWQMLFVVLSVAWGLRTERRGSRRTDRGAHRPVRCSTGSQCGSACWACSAAGR